MPPRAKKHRLSANSLAVASVISSRPIGNNSKHDFVNLPSELHFMILHNFPAIPEAEILVNPVFIEQPQNGLSYVDRFRVTLALSQTCRDLRSFYLPLCWERVQSCMKSRHKRHWYQDSSLGIQTQGKGLLKKSPHLLPLVKIVMVGLSRFEFEKSLPRLAELLENLPNLESIQVVHAHGGMSPMLGDAFGGKKFSSVRSVILPNCANQILRCCPEVREVVCNEHDGGRLIVALLDGDCNKVEILRGLTPAANTLKRFARINPPLRLVRLGAQKDNGESIRRFACFPTLRVIEIDCSEEEHTGLVPVLVKAAKETLAACPSSDLIAKSKSTRAKKDAAAAREKLANMYSEPKLVRVRYLPGKRPRKDFPHEDPSYFYPSRVEEYPA